MNHGTCMPLRAGGWAVLKEVPGGVMVVWDNGLEVVLRRKAVVELARVLAEHAEWKEWT